MTQRTSDTGLPVKVDPTSNGEFRPVPLTPALRRANALARTRIGEHARRVGMSRRHFLRSLCGAATTLATLGEAFAAQGNRGGLFALPKEAPFEPAAAEAVLAGDELIFDVQTHMVDPTGAWRRNAGRYWEDVLRYFPQGACGERDPVDCYSAERFIKHVFLDSDTDLAVLSFVPELPERNPLSLEEAERLRVLVERLDGAQRLFLHCMVVPNAPAIEPLRLMEDAVARYPIAAWKTYTQWGPEGQGWELDSPKIGIPFIEKARQIGIRNICVHKGLLFSGFPEELGRCADVGRAARLYPDMRFIIYHSGFETAHPEGPFDPDRAERGVDVLIRSLLDNGIGPGGNVYAELGSTWRFVMRDPTTAAHLLGKLLKFVGEDNVLWGTDSIWYGSPQDQIQAFRSFQIAGDLVDRHGYPPLTAERKTKIFGLNGAKVYGVELSQLRRRTETDPLGRRKAAYRQSPEPLYETLGPKTAREFEALLAVRGGLPA
jgi:hypothetical protein